MGLRAVVSACLALGSIGSWALTVVPMGLSELARKASVVVHGRVVQIEVDPISGRRTAILEPLDVVKGDVLWKQERAFYIPLLSRAIPRSDLIQTVPGSPNLELEEEVVAFLQPVDPAREGALARRDGRRIFVLEGLQQGRWRVVQDKNGIRRALSWDEAPEKLLSADALRAQKTSRRLKARSLRTPRSTDLENRRTLDSVLNAVRAAGGA